MEIDEKYDDDQARRLEQVLDYIVQRAENNEMSIHTYFGDTQDPLISVGGDTVSSLLIIKHEFGARISENPGNGRWKITSNAVARIRRWEAVRACKLLAKISRFRKTVKYSYAQDVIMWGYRHRNDEDNQNPQD